MVFCLKCGALMDDESDSCYKCGAVIESASNDNRGKAADSSSHKPRKDAMEDTFEDQTLESADTNEVEPAQKKIKWFILASVAIFLLIMVVVLIKPDAEDKPIPAADEQPAPLTQQTATNYIGDSVEVNGLTYCINAISVAESLSDGSNQFTPKGQYIIFNMQVTNVGEQSRVIDTALFELVESDGTVYNPELAAGIAANVESLFFSTELAPGMSLQGNVVFDFKGLNSQYLMKVLGGTDPTQYQWITLQEKPDQDSSI